jgi:biopolymer transport protein ExbB
MIMFLISLKLLVIPFLIVGLWKSRPVASIVVATLVAYLFMIIPGLIQTFQALMIYGAGDPELIAGGIGQALASSSLALIVVLPLLILFQLAVRAFRKYKYQKSDMRRSFE